MLLYNEWTKKLHAKERATEELHNNNWACKNRSVSTIFLSPNDAAAEEEEDEEEEGKAQVTTQCPKALCWACVLWFLLLLLYLICN